VRTNLPQEVVTAPKSGLGPDPEKPATLIYAFLAVLANSLT